MATPDMKGDKETSCFWARLPAPRATVTQVLSMRSEQAQVSAPTTIG